MLSTIQVMKSVFLTALVMVSFNVLAMPQCSPESTGGSELTALFVLFIAVIVASIVTLKITKKSLALINIRFKILGILAGICIWLVIVYAGLIAFGYFLLTCF